MSFFDLLDSVVKTEHYVGGGVGAAIGLLMPFWGAIINAIKWFKNYAAASKAEKAKQKAAEWSFISELVAEEIKKKIIGTEEEDKSTTII